MKVFAPVENRYPARQEKEDDEFGRLMMQCIPSKLKAVIKNLFFIFGAALVLVLLLVELLRMDDMLLYNVLLGILAAVLCIAILLSVLELLDGFFSHVDFFQYGLVAKKRTKSFRVTYDTVAQAQDEYVNDVTYSRGTSGRVRTRGKSYKKVWQISLTSSNGRIVILREDLFPLLGRKVNFLKENLK